MARDPSKTRSTRRAVLIDGLEHGPGSGGQWGRRVAGGRLELLMTRRAARPVELPEDYTDLIGR
jgi:hypothetical protein